MQKISGYMYMYTLSTYVLFLNCSCYEKKTKHCYYKILSQSLTFSYDKQLERKKTVKIKRIIGREKLILPYPVPDSALSNVQYFYKTKYL